MKNIRIFYWVLSFAALFTISCDRYSIDDTTTQVDLAYLIGKWGESYDDEYIAFDSSVTYSFEDNKSFSCYFCSWISDETTPETRIGSFTLSEDGLLRMESNDGLVEEQVVQRISENVMIWVKPGTEDLPARYLDNRRRFVRKR